IQGTWQIVALEAGGKPEPERNYKWNSFTFSRDKSNDKAVLREVGHLPTDFTFKLDPIPTPKTIDLTTKTGITLRGIYKLEGDDLTMCLSVGSSRPTEFATKAGGDTETFTLKRSKWEKYTDRTFGFSVEMPGKPEERVRTTDTPAGMTSTTFLVARSD